MTALIDKNFEYFTIAMFNGSSGVGQLSGLPPGPDNNDTYRLIVAVESTFVIYFAQILHFNYRQPVVNNRNVSASPGQTLWPFDKRHSHGPYAPLPYSEHGFYENLGRPAGDNGHITRRLDPAGPRRERHAQGPRVGGFVDGLLRGRKGLAAPACGSGLVDRRAD